MNRWIGTSGFQYPEWKGGFYPEAISVAKMLPFYAQRFATTEINYTFRRVPSAQTIQRWSEGTPARFKFSLKAPQKITHSARLRDCTQPLTFFHEAIRRLDAKLGVVLFQLPPNFKNDAGLLREFLAALPAGLRAAFEFRHGSWFSDEIFEALRKSGAALCVAESEDLATPAVATANFGYLRLRREDYRRPSLKRWAKFVREQTQWREAFVYFKHEETGAGPKFARTFQSLLATKS